MLAAAEFLLGRKRFEDLTVAEITRKAGVSVGLFYTRFDNKDALLSALHEQHMVELHASTANMFDSKRWKDVSVEEFVATLVAYTVHFHRRKRGLLRAIVLRHHNHPDQRYEHPSERAKSTVARVGAFLASRSAEIPHPQPRLAGSLGFLFLLGTVREKILFAEGAARAVRISDRKLITELTRAFLAYLGLRPPRKE